MRETICVPQNLKYVLFEPLKKKFPNPIEKMKTKQLC